MMMHGGSLGLITMESFAALIDEAPVRWTHAPSIRCCFIVASVFIGPLECPATSMEQKWCSTHF